MLGLAGSAMAKLRVEWLLSAELVLDFTAMAAGLVPGLEVFVGRVNLIWGPLHPFLNHLSAFHVLRITHGP